MAQVFSSQDDLNAKMDEMVRREAEELPKRMKLASELVAKDPALPFISAMIMATDLRSVDRSLELMTVGMKFSDALRFVGSYGRLEFVMKCLEQKKVTEKRVFKMLPKLWPGADPDDTDPRFLKLWFEAWKLNNFETILDDKKKPVPGDSDIVTIYRGQDEGAPFGIAWSTDYKVARKFANGAATRQWDRGEVVYQAKIQRSNIWAYLTGRGEQETIVDPGNFLGIPRVKKQAPKKEVYKRNKLG